MSSPDPATLDKALARIVQSAISRRMAAEVDPVLSFNIEHRLRERDGAISEAVTAIRALLTAEIEATLASTRLGDSETPAGQALDVALAVLSGISQVSRADQYLCNAAEMAETGIRTVRHLLAEGAQGGEA